MLLNAESLPNKINELSAVITANPPDLIVVTESHCNSLTADAVISLNGFNLTRADHTVGRKGGVILFSRSEFPIINIHVTSHPSGSWEGLYCDLLVSKTVSLRVCCIYRSPGKLTDDAESDFLTFLRESRPASNTPYLLSGDFNFPNIN